MSPPPRVETAEVVLLTPPGRGAVATILLAGPGAETALAECFRPRAKQIDWNAEPGRVRVGRWIDPAGESESWEDVVVLRPRAEQFEIHCHGGPTVVARVVDTLTSLGVVPRDWPAWQESQSGLLDREAVEALAAARSQRTAAILLDQFRGALAAEVAAIADLVSSKEETAAAERLAALLERVPFGLHLTQTWRVVVSGPPNAGKSSLVNALAGYERAIVSPVPGTTRDVLSTALVLDGWPLELSDTAGLREGLDRLEAAGIARAKQQLLEADLVIELLDGGALPGRETVATLIPPASSGGSRAAILKVVSKADLAGSGRIAPQVPLRVSALTGQGFEELTAAISQRLVPQPPAPGTALPFTTRQIDLLAAAHDAVLAGDASTVLALLARVTA